MLEKINFLKLAICLLLLWVSSFTALAQGNTKDSLLTLVTKEHSDTARISRLLKYADEFFLKNANYAIEFSLRALYLSREIKSPDYEEKALVKVGVSLYYAGVYDEAVKYFVELLNRAEAKGDKKDLLKMHINLIAVKLINSKYDTLLRAELFKTLALANEVIKTSGDSTVQYEYIPLIYNHLSYLLQLNGELEAAEDYLKQSLAITTKNPHSRNKTINTLIVYTELLLNSGRADEAIEMVGRYQSINSALKQPAIDAQGFQQLARAYTLKKDHLQTLRHLKRGYQHMKEMNNLPMMADSEDRLSKVYEELGQADSALYYANQHKVHQEKVTLGKANEELARFEVMEQFRKVEESLKSEKKSMVRGFIITAAVIFLLIATGIYMHVALRKKYRIVELDKMNVELNTEKLKLEKVLLEAELESNSKQMVTEVLSRMKKNEIVSEVVGNLMSLKRNDKKEVRSAVNSALRQLEQSMEDQAMEDFELRFKNVHLEFYRNLNELHPGLTPNERRMCAFLKLDMSAKEIAAVTGQSLTSIYTARSRLRQKLGLQNTDRALSDFIAGLG